MTQKNDMLLVSKRQVEEFKAKAEKYYQSVIDNPAEIDIDSWRHISGFLFCMHYFNLIDTDFYMAIDELRSEAFNAHCDSISS